VDDFTILTVCSGNICRSPVAAQLLRKGLADIAGVSVESAGTVAKDGDTMPTQAMALSAFYGGDPTGHEARYLVERHVSGAQLVFAMAREHRAAIVSLLPRATRYTFTIREFGRLAAGISDLELAHIAALPLVDVSSRLSAAVALVASRRGQFVGPEHPEEDDVVDPYRRSDETFMRSGQQLVPSVNIAISLLRRAATII
jgi:protein-tyrosine phosphatase